MRKQELDNWIKNGGDLPQDLTVDEKSYLEGLGWKCSEEWYSNGQKRYEYNYHHGKKHGAWRDWYRNGQKYFEHSYHHGKSHGTYKVWKEDGTLESHEEYAYGILLKDFLK